MDDDDQSNETSLLQSPTCNEVYGASFDGDTCLSSLPFVITKHCYRNGQLNKEWEIGGKVGQNPTVTCSVDHKKRLDRFSSNHRTPSWVQPELDGGWKGFG